MLISSRQGIFQMPKHFKRIVMAIVLGSAQLGWIGLIGAQEHSPTYPALPSETPENFNRIATDADFDLREVMIPMRDGVKLRTFILVPHGAKRAGMLLTRTPYDAK